MRHAVPIAIALLLGACDPGENPVPARSTDLSASDADPSTPETESRRRAVPGRFRTARDTTENAVFTPEQRRLADELGAIGYASGSQPARAAGITRYDRGAAQPGLNFFTSGHAESASLIDMEGNVLHEWRYSSADAFATDPASESRTRDHWWRRAYLFPNGDVLALITGAGLLKIDANSSLLWATPIHAHHDLAFAPNGDIYLLTRRIQIVPRINPDQPIVEDRVVVLDADGNPKRSFSLLDAFENSDFSEVWYRTGRRSGDVFHTNSIEFLDGTVAAVDPAFRAGNLLVSMLHLNAVAVIDPDQERVVWAHTGEYRTQHDPKILPNGNLLLFDNHGEIGPSAVLEFDPRTMAVVWEFRGSEAEPFYSKTCGTSERLANGNTLISETDFGRAFEVTPEGRVVWEFYNPHRAGDDHQFIASLPEMIRLPPTFPTDWLDANSSNPKPDES